MKNVTTTFRYSFILSVKILLGWMNPIWWLSLFCSQTSEDANLGIVWNSFKWVFISLFSCWNPLWWVCTEISWFFFFHYSLLSCVRGNWKWDFVWKKGNDEFLFGAKSPKKKFVQNFFTPKQTYVGGKFVRLVALLSIL